MIPRRRVVTVSTCPANSHASARRSLALVSSCSSVIVELRSVATVTQTTMFSLSVNMNGVHAVRSRLAQHTSGLVDHKAHLGLGLASLARSRVGRLSVRKGTHHQFLVVDPVKQVFHPAPARESERRTAQHASLPDFRSHTALELALPSVLFALWDHRNSSIPRELCGAQRGKAWCVPSESAQYSQPDDRATRIRDATQHENSVTSLTIASAPSLTLNPTCCSCGSTTR